VLDECDEMLNMGFVDDVELILNAANNSGAGAGSSGATAAAPGFNASGGTLQTLLFSATMPRWVKDITSRFLVKDYKLIDLVGDDKLKVGRASVMLRNPGAGQLGSCGQQHDGQQPSRRCIIPTGAPQRFFVITARSARVSTQS
jgi:hypothetical protein